MKILIFSFLLMLSLNSFCQNSTTSYFDEAMQPVAKKEATIYGIGKMDSGLYKLTCYYLKKKKPLACVMYFSDATQAMREGKYQRFSEEGNLEAEGNYVSGKKQGLWIHLDKKGNIDDSTEYKDDKAVMHTAIYDLSENHQKLILVDDPAKNEFSNTLYNDKGDVISTEKIPQDYTDIYMNDAQCTFPGGPSAWQRYVTRAIMAQLDAFTDEDYGTVLLRFVVDTSGNITDLETLCMKNTMLAKVVFNVIKNGPQWVPAEYNGKKIKAIRIQPVTIANPKKGKG
mgnify:CR=1 FL=1